IGRARVAWPSTPVTTPTLGCCWPVAAGGSRVPGKSRISTAARTRRNRTGKATATLLIGRKERRHLRFGPLRPHTAGPSECRRGSCHQPPGAPWRPGNCARFSRVKPSAATLRSWAIGLTVGIAVTVATLLGAQHFLELRSLDLRFRLRGPIPPGTPIVVISIDD